MSSFKTGEQLLDLIQDKYPGYHPIVHAADIAHDETASAGVQLDAVKTMLKYTVPDVKSIDISARIGGNMDQLELIAYGLTHESEDDDEEYSSIIEGEYDKVADEG